jgi:phage gp29-like protein
MILPQGVDASQSYDVELTEATSQSWQIFPGLVDRCDMDIVLAILMQNLTTEVTGGSFAATNSHMDIRQQGIEDDDEAFKGTIRDQIARPFAALNFGDADLAPTTDWDVQPQEDKTQAASRFYSFGQSLQILRQGGIKFTDEDKLRTFAKASFGLELPDFEITEPDNGSGTGAAGAQDEAANKTLKGGK